MIAPQTTSAEIIVWCLILIGGIGILGLIVWRLRRWSLDAAGPSGAGGTWTLQELREMRAAGELSEEEFEALKAQHLHQFHADAVDAHKA